MTTLDAPSHIHRFAFASFDEKEEKKAALPKPELKKQEPAPAAAPAAPPLPLQLPAITEKDVQAAKADAQAQGYREGYSAAQAKFDKEAAAREDAVKSLLEVIANRITIAAESHGTALQEREELMGKLVMAAARKVAGDALRREPYAGVESLLRECLAMIMGEKTVKIVVSSALAPGLKQRIDTLKPLLQGFSGELVVEEDSALMDQDCRVEWMSGMSERGTDELWRAIEAIVMKTNVN